MEPIRTIRATTRHSNFLAAGAGILIALAARLLLSTSLPFTLDEGAYLMDAKLLLAGRLPGGDILTKSPLTALVYTVAVAVTGGSLFAARAASVILSLAATWPLYAAAAAAGRRAGLLAAALWLVSSGPVIWHAYGLTHALAALTSLGAYAAWLRALHRADRHAAIAAGLLVAAAVMSRKSTLVLVPVLLVLGYLSGQARARPLLARAALSAALPLALWLAAAGALYGWPGVSEAAGVAYAGIIIGPATGWGANWRQSLIIAARTLIPLAAPLLLALHAIARGSQAATRLPLGRVVAVLAAALAVLCAMAIVWRGNPVLRLLGLLWLFTAVLLLWRGCRSDADDVRVPPDAVLGPLYWLLLLGLLYALWPAFILEYLADFFAPAILLIAAVLAALPLSPASIRATAALWLGANALAVGYTAAHPWTGTYTRAAITQAAVLLQHRVPLHESILTAAVIVPYLSGHPVVGDITHPLWYRYRFIAYHRRAAFLPDTAQLRRGLAHGNITWQLRDTVTRYAYQPVLPAAFSPAWQEQDRVQNSVGGRHNPLRLLRRIAPPSGLSPLPVPTVDSSN